MSQKTNSPSHIGTRWTLIDDFQQTRWSLVIRAQDGASSALDELCRIYWYPIYAYIRRRGNTPEETEDLTQGYFLSLLERGYLKRADREKGKMREFLLADLKYFLSSEWRKKTAQKRGGGAIHIPIDQGWAEDRYQYEPVDNTTPETLFERRWALTVLDRAMERLKQYFEARGKGDLFRATKDFISWNPGGENYAEVAQRIGMSENNIKVTVHRMRKRYRKILEDEVGQTLDDPAEVKEEIRYLASALV